MTKNRLKNFFPHLFLDFGKLHMYTYPKAIPSDFKITEFFSKVGCNGMIIFHERTQMCIYGNLVFSKKGGQFWSNQFWINISLGKSAKMFIKNVCYCHLIKLILKKIALHLSAFDFSKQTGRKKHCNTWHRICRFNICKSQKVLYSM